MRASADWLIIPHLGTVFGGATTIVDLDQGAGSRKFTFGGSAAWLTDGIVGLEADIAHTPHFFERDKASALVLDSSVTTATGSIIIAVPLSVTRESLRPYLVGGVGLMHASSSDALGLLSFDSDLLAMNVGGGVIGFLTPFTGIRFDLRQFRNLAPDGSATTTSGSTRLSFWRASAGVVIRY
ncbi:MAG: hypothetical protein ABL986_12085 [Vicinamibacterales bacterium]